MSGDEFCPRQIIFELPGNPGVVVTATECNGAIDFIIDVEDTPETTADLRALFFHFNELKLPGLTITGGDGLLTEWRKGANSILDLGDGATLAGKVKGGFDVGLEWGTPGGKGDDIYFPVHFTLSSSAGPLTLDDFGGLLFGAKLDSIGGAGGVRNQTSKLTAIAPWAPDAKDDTFTIFEDGAADLNSPSKSPQFVVLNVLADNGNGVDEDKDGQSLTITGFHDEDPHGTLTISADGKSVIYTPDLDFSGVDTFEYCVSDGNGGQDSATVTVIVTAVADEPVFTWSVDPGATINEMLITLTASQNDADSSEFLDRIVVDNLPAGWTLTPLGVNPAGEPDTISQVFKLVVPAQTDIDYDLGFTAFARETSNGDEENATLVVPIEINFTHNTAQQTFTATDQNIWESGDQFKFEDRRFLGIDESFDEGIDAIPNPFVPGGLPALPAEVGISGHLKVGFQTEVLIDGGGIDATLQYDLTVDTTLNKTTDRLLIQSSALLANGFFNTTGPSGHFSFAPVLDFFLEAHANFLEVIDLGSYSLGPYTLDDIFTDPPSFTFDSEDASWTIPVGYPGLTATFQWPHISVAGAKTGDNVISGDTEIYPGGPDPRFFYFELDVETLAISLFPLLAPLELNPGDPDALTDFDINVGLALVQDFILTIQSLKGTITFEDGDSFTFIFGQDLTFDDVLAQHDENGDGVLGYTLAFAPEAKLNNSTDIGISAGYKFDFLKDIPIVEEVLNPVFHAEGQEVIPVFEVYGKEFAFNFDSGASLGLFA
jgi:hypothetical protein